MFLCVLYTSTLLHTFSTRFFEIRQQSNPAKTQEVTQCKWSQRFEAFVRQNRVSTCVEVEETNNICWMSDRIRTTGGREAGEQVKSMRALDL